MAPLTGELANLSDEENLKRMAAGQLYHCFTPQLTQQRYRCKKACEKFNDLRDPTRRQKVQLWREITEDSRPLPPELSDAQADEDQFHDTDAWIDPPLSADYGYNIQVAPTAMINVNATFVDTCLITIGARTLVGPGVHFYSGTHPLDPAIRNGIQGPESGAKVIIEEDVWLAGNVTVLPNVKIGRGATVGAGSVVTKDVAPFTLVAGNPARFIRKIDSAWNPESSLYQAPNAAGPTRGPEAAMSEEAKRVEQSTV